MSILHQALNVFHYFYRKDLYYSAINDRGFLKKCMLKGIQKF